VPFSSLAQAAFAFFIAEVLDADHLITQVPLSPIANVAHELQNQNGFSQSLACLAHSAAAARIAPRFER